MPRVNTLLKITISLVILGLLFTQFPLFEILPILKQSQLNLFLWSTIIAVLSVVINTFRWQLLLKAQGFKHPFMPLLKLVFTGIFFNTYLPGGIIGEIIRITQFPKSALSKEEEKNHILKITASVVMDRFMGFLSIMVLAIIGCIFSYSFIKNSQVFFIFNIIAGAGIFVLLILLNKKIQYFLFEKSFTFLPRFLKPLQEQLTSFMKTLSLYNKDYSLFIKRALPLSILSNLCVVYCSFLLARAIDINIDFFKLLAFVPMIEFVAALPITIAGLGIREAATVLLFSSIGISAAKAFSVSILSFVLILILGAIGACHLIFWPKGLKWFSGS